MTADCYIFPDIIRFNSNDCSLDYIVLTGYLKRGSLIKELQRPKNLICYKASKIELFQLFQWRMFFNQADQLRKRVRIKKTYPAAVPKKTKTMCKTTLKVEFATKNFEFAFAEDPTNVADNLSKMASVCDSIATQTQAGIVHNQHITVYGRWVVVYKPEQDDSGKYRPSLQFFDLEIDTDLLRAASEGQDDLETSIIQAIDEYRSVFDPEKHDRVRLLSKPPD